MLQNLLSVHRKDLQFIKTKSKFSRSSNQIMFLRFLVKMSFNSDFGPEAVKVVLTRQQQKCKSFTGFKKNMTSEELAKTGGIFLAWCLLPHKPRFIFRAFFKILIDFLAIHWFAGLSRLLCFARPSFFLESAFETTQCFWNDPMFCGQDFLYKYFG